MSEELEHLKERCAELEQQLHEAENKATYYQKSAEQAGITRLRETEALSRLLAEHKRAQEELAKSEANLRRIIDLVPHMIFAKNREGRFLLVNTAVARSLGTTVDDLTGKLHADVHPHLEEVGQMLTDDLKVIESGQMLRIPEEPYTDMDGEIHWLQTVRVPYITADTSEPAILGVAIDITEYKRMQASLQASENRFHDLFENSPDAIFVEDSEGNVLDVNRAACQLHGMERDELVGKNVLELVPPDRRKQVAREWPDIMGGKETRFESFSWTKDDRSVPVEIRISKIHYSGLPAILLHVRDITERKQTEKELQQHREHLEELVEERTAELTRAMQEAMQLNQKLHQEIVERKKIEEALRESEERFRAIFETARDSIFIKDRQLRYTHVNPAMEWLFGCPASELIGKTDSELIGEEAGTHIQHTDSQVLAGKIQEEEETSQVYGDLMTFHVIKVPLYDNNGKIIGLCGISRDITERKRAEDQIKTSLQEKNILLKEVHHRVKNNLQVISSLLNLQAALLKDEHAKAIFKESQYRIRTMALIHEKLYQSKTLTDIDFDEYVKTLAHELYVSYKPFMGTIELVIDVADVHLGIDTAIPCGLILHELISNALKYAFPNGKGSVRITLSEPSSGMYELVIRDDGVGLPGSLDMNTISSLGLQLVKGLVEEQLNGSLELDRHQGTTWRIRFQA